MEKSHFKERKDIEEDKRTDLPQKGQALLEKTHVQGRRFQSFKSAQSFIIKFLHRQQEGSLLQFQALQGAQSRRSLLNDASDLSY